ncbi:MULTISPECIES: hypothetical protein [Hydrogenophaga]|nr:MULTISPECIES: hypothetical protein [Hydrogenophaga]MCM3566339.1 hypothetical protein [Hydrogenophaga intermedia]
MATKGTNQTLPASAAGLPYFLTISQRHRLRKFNDIHLECFRKPKKHGK